MWENNDGAYPHLSAEDMVDAKFENNDPTSRPGTTNHWMELRIAGFFKHKVDSSIWA